MLRWLSRGAWFYGATYLALSLLFCGWHTDVAAQQTGGTLDAASAQRSVTAGSGNRRPSELGPGDSIAIQVYGQPDMSATVGVADDGTVTVPLAGQVKVDGLSPSEAARRIEKALSDGKFLITPQVIVTVAVSRSQRVSVLGEVGTPGRYTLEPNTSIFDLLAQAGGAKDTSGDVVYLLRADAQGKTNRYPIDLKGLASESGTVPAQTLQGGDTILVPRAPQFYIFGEVTAPNMYRLEPGMTVVQAIVRAGGVTPRGSRNRFELKRKDPNGVEYTVKAGLSEPVQPGDVIRVKESIF